MYRYVKNVLLKAITFLFKCCHLISRKKILFTDGGAAIFPSVILDATNMISVCDKGILHRGKLSFKGRNNTAEISGFLYKTMISVDGDDCSVLIGRNCSIKKCKIVIKGNNNTLKIDDDTTFGSDCWVVLMGNDNKIEIGKDCMIAENVDIWASDSHPIFGDQACRKIINPSGSIILSDHVWLGKNSTVLKNVEIGKNAVVGTGSMVTKNIPSCCIAVGNPAKVVNEGINWDRKHINV